MYTYSFKLLSNIMECIRIVSSYFPFIMECIRIVSSYFPFLIKCSRIVSSYFSFYFSELNIIQPQKLTHLVHYWSDKGLNGTVVNLICPSGSGGLLEAHKNRNKFRIKKYISKLQNIEYRI